ncbi:MAG TPA: multicopper oxidase domain-containing protein [Acidobacteriota bacterium]|nr:multicopper oxidase domain-containing protein [Acidobacteriota bacterium]
MRFKVVAATSEDRALTIADQDLTPGIDPFLLQWGLTTPPKGVKRRFLTLNEYSDEFGRLIQILGNADAPFGSPYTGTDNYLQYPTATSPTDLKAVGSTSENVKSGSTEVWEIFNTTGDVHPMHFHLVNVQVINRQLFDLADPTFSTFTGDVIPPAPNELGWKETVPMYPGTVTRIIMKFDLSQAQIIGANGKVIKTPSSPRTGGAEYVWHCHILEHEEHDMMHALVVT